MAREIKSKVKIWNLDDEIRAQMGLIRPEEVRAVELDDVIVDTGATRLVLPEALIHTLGLSMGEEITVRYADNRVAKKRTDIPLYNLLRIELCL